MPWSEILWFLGGAGVIWGFLRILPDKLYGQEFPLHPLDYYTVPSRDADVALGGVGDTAAAYTQAMSQQAMSGGAYIEGPNEGLSHEAYIEAEYEPGLHEDERMAMRQALIERLAQRAE